MRKTALPLIRNANAGKKRSVKRKLFMAAIGDGIKIAVFDAGVAYDHAELSIAGGGDFIGGASGNCYDDNGHGSKFIWRSLF